MLVSKDVFDSIPVSYYKFFKGGVTTEITVSRVFRGIQSDFFKDKVLSIRENLMKKQKDKADEIKRSLHAVTFCGTFNGQRKTELCEKYNNLLVIDIDDISEADMDFVEDCLMKDKYVAAFWKSPSGKGFKGLVHLDYENSLMDDDTWVQKHKIAFRSLFDYLLANYGIELDKSGSDITRLCFMSWDENIVVKNEAEAFAVNLDKKTVLTECSKKKETVESEHFYLNWNEIRGNARNYSHHQEFRFKLQNIYKKLKKRNLSITDNYEDWVKVAFAIASNIHPDKGRELFLKLCELDGAKHDAKKSEDLIFKAYQTTKGMVGFNTIIYLARQKGIVFN